MFHSNFVDICCMSNILQNIIDRMKAFLGWWNSSVVNLITASLITSQPTNSTSSFQTRQTLVVCNRLLWTPTDIRCRGQQKRAVRRQSQLEKLVSRLLCVTKCNTIMLFSYIGRSNVRGEYRSNSL